MSTWVIVGATRGVGLEFVRQLLERGDQVFATARNPMRASELWTLVGAAPLGACRLLECDVTEDASISRFISDVVAMRDLQRIDYVVLNAGILRYPNRATEMSFDDFSDHMKTNAIGPIILAQKLIKTGIPIGTIIFMTSDSGSATEFRAFEDGFAAYAASKAALNQALRHMAVELSRQRSSTSILAMHPGEVSTEIAEVPLGREIDGIVSTAQSVYGMLRVIRSKTIYDSGTFWTWEGREHPW